MNVNIGRDPESFMAKLNSAFNKTLIFCFIPKHQYSEQNLLKIKKEQNFDEKVN